MFEGSLLKSPGTAIWNDLNKNYTDYRVLVYSSNYRVHAKVKLRLFWYVTPTYLTDVALTI